MRRSTIALNPAWPTPRNICTDAELITELLAPPCSVTTGLGRSPRSRTTSRTPPSPPSLTDHSALTVALGLNAGAPLDVTDPAAAELTTSALF
ncbi:hypothetical protein [Streptomyces sp. NPDC059176]|uniref:hypothetical protein n=1 Tax=Streptomyces sp. NPDC059176 TaxID=3346758 RepID=UPI0036B3F904